MRKWTALVIAVVLMAILSVGSADTEKNNDIDTVTEYRWFVNRYRNVRSKKVTYFDNVYAYNHGVWGLTPFSSTVPSEYFVKDQDGMLAVAPIVWDITDAMRIRLYGGDIGETALLYGQYCERIKGKKNKIGFSGIHEGIDFVSVKGDKLHAILGGVVTKAGDKNGTVGIYNEEYDITLLYLHTQKICVKRGDVVEAGDIIGQEGSKAIYAGYENNVLYADKGIKHVHTSHYTHVELRKGRYSYSSKYWDVILQSDCPYESMRIALNVVPSGRTPITASSMRQAEIQRQKEEEEARLAMEAAMATPTPAPTPEIKIVEETNNTQNSGYGFAEATPAPVVEATLPPATI